MKESGVNVNIFGSHSTPAASTSKCKAAGLSFKEISNRQGGQPNVLSHYIMTSQLRKIFLRLFFSNFVNIDCVKLLKFGNIYVVCNAFKHYNNQNLFFHSYS